MNDLSFANFTWIYLIWGILGFMLLIAWLEHRSNHAISRFISSTLLQQQLIQRVSNRRKWLRLLFLTLAGICLSLALMRPQWGFQLISTPQVGADIMICLDVSKSMLAEDVAPNRLERAKAEINDLLNLIDGDQVGLIAFAGRATVLSPMTPDFGFLRLTLKQTNSNSVTRGGTRLEAPIRKAIAGFQSNSKAAQVIILITDGEDHDSFPLEAAKAAAERGIRIIAIGFGNENGSEIVITDPNTGARKTLRDADNQVITTRLDGDMLRQLALTTQGVYIPAGTGVLDLESIYQQHIATLMRGHYDGKSRSIQNDAFQWAILMGLIFFVAAIMVTSPTKQQMQYLLLFALLPSILFSFSPNSIANEEKKEAVPVPIRQSYNQAIIALKQNDDAKAEELLTTARNNAKVDGELRFNATYDLGWLKVKQADKLLEKQPKDALKALELAASWFQEAINLRPKHQDSRYNLEIVLRRMMILRDHLTKTEKGDLATQLAALIKAQRALLNQLRPMIHKDPKQTTNKHAYRHLASQQLERLSDVQSLNEQVDQEIHKLKDKPEKEQTAKDKVRLAQLTQLQFYLQQAQARMGKARSQMRRVQAERAFRRVAAALSELKQARDQLLDPVKRLDILLQDGFELAKLTATRAAVLSKAPAWLTQRYLEQSQTQLQQRLTELHTGLAAGLKQAETPKEKKQQQFLAQLKQAEPLLAQANEQFQQALPLIKKDDNSAALVLQQQGLEKLATAREIFLTLKPLIDLLSQSQQQIQSLLQANEKQPEAPLESVDVALQQQQKNIKRDSRVNELIANALFDALSAVENSAENPTKKDKKDKKEATNTPKPTPNAAQLKAEKERLEQADKLHLAVSKALIRANKSLQALQKDANLLADTRIALDDAVVKIENLRRLFFSVVEHLKETLQRQQTLADKTETATKPLEKSMGPLKLPQQNLVEMSEKIAQALMQQANAPTDGQQKPPEAKQQQAQLKQAAGHVDNATKQMKAALSNMNKTQLDATRKAQDVAIDELKQALAALQPPQKQKQQQKQQQKQKQQQQKQQQQQQQQKQGQKDKNKPQEQGNMDQLLQAIKDREAKRRQDQQNKKTQHPSGYETVEKDW